MTEFGELRGKRVEFTGEFFKTTTQADLAEVLVTLPSGKQIRPFRKLEVADEQLGLDGD